LKFKPHSTYNTNQTCKYFIQASEIHSELLLAVLKPNKIIRKRTDANCCSFHIRVFLVLSNPQGQRQTTTLSIPRDNFRERNAKLNLEMSRTTQM
jgi:hypothetical protein